jgi:hypothetical protein
VLPPPQVFYFNGQALRYLFLVCGLHILEQ